MAKKKRWQPPHPDPLKGKIHRQQPRKREPYRGNEICRWGGCGLRRSLLVTQHHGKNRDKPFPLCDNHIIITVRAYLAADDLAPNIPEGSEAVRQLVEERREATQPVVPEPREGSIYYFEVGDLIKVGYSMRPYARLKDYPPTTRWLAVEPGTTAIERARHSLFHAHLSHGREWFHPHPEVLAWIDQVVAKHGPPPIEHYPFTTPDSKEPVVAGRRYYMPQAKM